jgi:hypothetical protein
MESRFVLRIGVVAVALLAARSVAADPITFTGNVAKDFNPQTNSDVVVIPHSDTPIHIAQPQWMTNSGFVSGWNIQDVRLGYDSRTDTMYVGVNTFGIAGNVDGNGTPGIPDQRLTAAGGSDPANFGGDKAMAVAFAPLGGTFDPKNPPSPVIVAGVPGNKAEAGTGTDGFTVAKWAPSGGTAGPNYDLVTSFGKTLPTGLGNLAFDPSAQHPGFEFTVNNFSKLLGANPLNGLVVSAQDGSVQSVVTGKDYVFSTPIEAQQIPEPATWLVWAGLAGGLAWRSRRYSRRSHRSSSTPGNLA